MRKALGIYRNYFIWFQKVKKWCMSQLEFGQERYLRACIDPAKRIRATRHGGQWSKTIFEGSLGV